MITTPKVAKEPVSGMETWRVANVCLTFLTRDALWAAAHTDALMRLVILLSVAASCVGTSVTTVDDGLGGFTPATSSCQYGKDYGARMTPWSQDLRRGGWRGAVLGPGGDKIYGIPTNASQVLEIDPEKRTLTTFGNLGERERTSLECAGSLNCGEDKWIGGGARHPRSCT